MNNFDYCCPTHIVFGKNTIEKLPHLIDKSCKILMTYGGGSIKQNGVYDKVKEALKGYDVIEFGGIEPNPVYETCMKAVEIVKNEKIDFILAVGGGSVLDGTKFIAAAAKYEGEDAWEDILVKGLLPADAVALGDVITLPATGSEMNCGAVISKKETSEKLSVLNPSVYPKFSIIDPETTFSLPEKQTINGIVDTFVHVMEQYCTYDVNSPLQDEWAIGIIKTLMQEAPKVLQNPNDYETRANIFWCATVGLNYWISLGVPQDWTTHMIGHEITAMYGLDHGQTLAVIMPRVLKNQIDVKRFKLEKLGKNAFGVNSAEETIDKIEEFFNSIGMKTKLADYGVDSKEAAEKVRDRFAKRGTKLGEHCAIDADVSYEIITKA